MLRADAGGATGSGHLLRSVALAQAWLAAGGEATLVTHSTIPALTERARAAGLDVVALGAPHPAPEDLVRTRDIARDAMWLVVDGYHFDPFYQASACDGPAHVMVIDDHAHLARYEADVLVNQNLGAEKLDYNLPPRARTLLGPQYALLRPEFAQAAAVTRPEPAATRASRVLVTMGGSDPTGATRNVLHALGCIAAPVEVRVLVGPGADVSGPEVTAGLHRVTLLRDVRDVPAQLLWADVVVAAAGTISWELACLGRPALLAVVADNQRGIAAALHASGAAVDLGWLPDLGPDSLAAQVQGLLESAPRRAAMASAARRLVDGHGARRVVTVLRSWSSKE